MQASVEDLMEAARLLKRLADRRGGFSDWATLLEARELLKRIDFREDEKTVREGSAKQPR